MAEEKFDQPTSPTPISERDLSPIEPLTPNKIVSIGNSYTRASFTTEFLGRRLEGITGELDADIIDSIHHEEGKRQAFREVLEILGQGRLISIIDERMDQMFEQS